MTFFVGQIVRPRRRFLNRASTYTTRADGRRDYPVDGLVDVAGYRSGFARVVENLGAAPLTCTFFDRSGASSYGRILAWNPTAWAPSTGYQVYDVRQANGKLWQCTVAGTSAAVGTGPSGSGTVVDGDVGPPDTAARWVELLAPETDEELSAVQTGNIYSADVWTIDGMGLVRTTYPESELVALTTHEEYIASSTAFANPENVLPWLSAVHVDLGSPPKEVSDMARAYELAGIDPRGSGA